jgi:hypothetical protein
MLVCDVRVFLGLAGYYHHFIHDYGSIVAPPNQATLQRRVLMDNRGGSCVPGATKFLNNDTGVASSII